MFYLKFDMFFSEINESPHLKISKNNSVVTKFPLHPELELN